jgi:hypothetical protein
MRRCGCLPAGGSFQEQSTPTLVPMDNNLEALKQTIIKGIAKGMAPFLARMTKLHNTVARSNNAAQLCEPSHRQLLALKNAACHTPAGDIFPASTHVISRWEAQNTCSEPMWTQLNTLLRFYNITDSNGNAYVPAEGPLPPMPPAGKWRRAWRERVKAFKQFIQL